MAVRFGRVVVKKPRHISPWAKECGITAVAMWVVEVREVKAPKNVEPLRWVLYTSHAVETFNDSWRVIEHYEKRPIIEEYHKALKTGCRMEARQYYTSARLEAVVGMLSVVAVRLLQLRSTARAEPERPRAKLCPCRGSVRCNKSGNESMGIPTRSGPYVIFTASWLVSAGSSVARATVSPAGSPYGGVSSDSRY